MTRERGHRSSVIITNAEKEAAEAKRPLSSRKNTKIKFHTAQLTQRKETR